MLYKEGLYHLYKSPADVRIISNLKHISYRTWFQSSAFQSRSSHLPKENCLWENIINFRFIKKL